MKRWLDGGSWSSGTTVGGLPAPATPGTQQTVVVSGLSASTRYHFQMRSRDAANNWSSLSNAAAARTLPPPDTQAPAAIASLAAIESTATSLTLRWTAPADAPGSVAVSGYEMKRWTDGGSWSTGTLVSGLPAPAAPGTPQSVIVSGLSASTRYHFQMSSRDAAANWSSLSNEAAARTRATPDATPPAAVTTLAATDSTTASVTVRWTAPADAPGGGAAAAYEMRRWTDGGSWTTGSTVSGLPTPAAPGTQQSSVISGLTASTRYHFQMKSRDASGNWSSASNEAIARTRATPDTQPPATVTLAAIDSTDTSITLRWTAPSDPPGGGAASAYELRRWADGGSWATGTVLAGLPAPATPGIQQTHVVPGLFPSTCYHFGLRTRDAAGNWSGIAEAVACTRATPDTQPPASITSLAAVDSTSTSITLAWIAPSDPPSGGAAASYELRRWTDGGSWASGISVAGLSGPAAPGTAQSATVAGLVGSTRYRFQIRSRDTAGNWSNLSNEAVARTRATPDVSAPAAVSDLAVVDSTENSITLLWTAPSDPPGGVAAASYEIRSWLTGGSWSTGTAVVAPVPAWPGLEEMIVVADLSPSTTYFIALRSRDAAGNVSPVSNTASGRTGSAIDRSPPIAVSDLVALGGGETTIELRWTAPADRPLANRVAGYEFRYWHANSPAAARVLRTPHSAPPGDPGTLDSRLLTGLDPGTDYVATVSAFDEAGNMSEPSNEAPCSTLPAADVQAPAAVADLAASPLSSTSVRLAWTAPADAPAGAAASYEVRRWTEGGGWETGVSVTAPLPGLPGDSESLTIDGLAPATAYAFAVESRDAAGNASPLSNVATATTHPPIDTQPPSAPASLTADLEDGVVDLVWQPSSEADVAGYHVYRRASGLPRERLTATPLPWTTYSDPAWPLETTHYSVTAVDVSGNESASSVEARVDPPEDPAAPKLFSNPFPNPFRATTTIVLPMDEGGHAPSASIYDVAGRLVAELAPDGASGDAVTFVWDGRNADGSAAASGLYMWRIERASGDVVWKRVSLIR